MTLKGRTILISGASRGIGLEMALRAARDGANIVAAAKTSTPHRYLPGTVYTAAAEIEAAGGQAMAAILDVRDDGAAAAVVEQAVARFGGIDIVVNNASAISMTSVEETEPKRWDLMMDVNARGAFFLTRAAIPHLRKSDNPHVLTIAPPLTMEDRWFSGCVAYTISKYAMSMMSQGMAAEFRDEGIAFNALWPRYGVATAGVEHAVGDAEQMKQCRKPAIMADAFHAIVTKSARDCTGNFFIDDSLLYAEGVRDFSAYGEKPGTGWAYGMYLPEGDREPEGS